jgi:hypothetical protein
MKKLFSCIMLVVVFLLVGCDKSDDGQVDLSKNAKVQSQLDADKFYGKVLHKGVMADQLTVKNFKFQENLFGYTVGLKGKDTKPAAVVFVCDLRMKGAAISYSIVNDEGYVPKGKVDISIMEYGKDVTDIREADENRDPVFSTANGDNDYLAGLHKAASLPGDTILAFVIDKGTEDNMVEGIAWSPLFTAKQLDKAMSKVRDTCEGLKLDLDNTYIAAAEEP